MRWPIEMAGFVKRVTSALPNARNRHIAEPHQLSATR